MPSSTVTETRRGREVEHTTTTPVTHDTFDAVANNRRFYDGALTGSFYWGLTGKSATALSRSEYESLLEAS